jgi:hypothetical protein
MRGSEVILSPNLLFSSCIETRSNQPLCNAGIISAVARVQNTPQRTTGPCAFWQFYAENATTGCGSLLKMCAPSQENP